MESKDYKRDKGPDVFSIKTGIAGRIRLFFSVLNHPWITIQTLAEFGEELGKAESEIVDLKTRLAETIFENTKLKDEVYSLKSKS